MIKMLDEAIFMYEIICFLTQILILYSNIFFILYMIYVYLHKLCSLIIYTANSIITKFNHKDHN